jgi:hypothetical protein
VKRRNLYLALIGALVLGNAAKLILSRNSDSAAIVGPSVTSVPAAEQRLDKLRQAAATVPGKQEVYGKAAGELAEREKAMIKAETLQQAQVTLIEMVQSIGRANGIDVHASQEFRQKPVNNDYGEVAINVAFACGMDQLVNMLTAIANQPQTLATDEIHITGGNDKRKNVQVRLSVSAPVPRKLLPQKKGVAAF